MPVRVLLIAALAMAACAAPQPSGGAPKPSGAAAARPNALQGVLAASELAVGKMRVPVGILEDGTPVNDATVHVRAYRGAPTDPLLVEADAPFKGDGLQGRGLYVTTLEFAAPGAWQIEIGARRPGGGNGLTRVGVNVLTKTTTPAVGEMAPASKNRTARDVADVAEIDSGSPPDDMHDLSIADAIAQHRPALIVFATPAFCTSATCGPEVHAVQALEPTYRDRMAFIHVEIYENYRPDPSKRRVVPTVDEWKLRSEPWVFLVDGGGVIRASFEGPTATDELRAAVDRLLVGR